MAEDSYRAKTTFPLNIQPLIRTTIASLNIQPGSAYVNIFFTIRSISSSRASVF